MSLSQPVSQPSFEPHIGRSVSIDHAAELLGVSRRTVYNRISEGRLHTVRTLGGSQRVLLESVAAIGGRLPDAPSRKTGRNLLVTATITLILLAGAARPASAQQRVRNSADVAGASAGSQDVNVVVSLLSSLTQVTALLLEGNRTALGPIPGSEVSA